MSFWDTSALLKLYTTEPDTPAYDALRQSLMPIHAARLAGYELRAAFRRREAGGVVANGAAQSAFKKFSADIIAGNVTIHEESPDVQAQFGGVLDTCYSQVRRYLSALLMPSTSPLRSPPAKRIL